MSASFADDIFLLSEKKRDLEAMIRDITTELEAVGLGLGANKSHWSSYPPQNLERYCTSTQNRYSGSKC